MEDPGLEPRTRTQIVGFVSILQSLEAFLGLVPSTTSKDRFNSRRGLTHALAAYLVFPPFETRIQCSLLAAVVNTTVVTVENLTVGSTVWLPAESTAPGR